jgi:hypothetical protein
MSDPKRLLDQAEDVTADERRALSAGRDVRPPSGFAGEVWGALAVQLPPVGGGGSAGAGGSIGPGAGASAAGAGGAKAVAGVGLVSIVKAVAIGAVVGSAVLAGRAIVPTSSSPVTASTNVEEHAEPVRAKPSQPDFAIAPPIPDRAPASEPVAPEQREAPAALDPPPRAPSAAERTKTVDRVEARPAEPSFARAEPTAPAPGSVPPEQVGDAREESRMVAAARDALRLGDPASSLGWLERAHQKFPNGVLVQEREALAIEALALSGRRDEAEKRAAAFLRDYPKSPHAARVQALVR